MKNLQDVISLSRRDLLKAGGAGLAVAVIADQAIVSAVAAEPTAAELSSGAFVRIGKDDTVTVVSRHTEMGQGAYTGVATLVAEELDADWSKVHVVGAVADASKYGNPAFGGAQGTGGSGTIANGYEQFRRAGATARALLVGAAAQRWNVPVGEITVANGIVKHSSGKSARFGELVSEAARLPVPADIKLKDPARFAYIGKEAARVDSLAKSNGTAQFTQDLHLPGMLTAVVLHPPRFGAKLKSVDSAKAMAIKGVSQVVAYETPVTSGVAVIAKDFWTARKARDVLVAQWDESTAFKRSSEEMFAEYRELAKKPGLPARKQGDVEKAFATAAKTVEAVYEFPYLAHATMEPMNCVVHIRNGECEVWNGTQLNTGDQAAVAKMLGIPASKVTVHMLYAGGSFGRRANPHSDYIVEATAIAKSAKLNVPVKLVWTREDDTKAGYYRPMYVHAMKAALDANGNITAWQHRIVGQSIFEGTSFAAFIRDGIDGSSVEGASNLPYHIPNLSVELTTTKEKVPVQWWRSVGSTHTAFATEVFIDEIARATNKDPYQLRRSLLEKHPRHLATLDLAVQKAGWGQNKSSDRVQGLALHESFNSVVAEVVDIVRTPNGPKIARVVCAVDCGTVVNPNIVAMQMESGIGYGLAAALTGNITLKEGLVQQGNFDDYPVLRINQMPKIEVHTVASTAKPTGVGEPGTPPIAPALANALAVLNSKPVRALPLSAQGITLV